ncbi:ATP synthase, partial [Mycena pura]
SSRYGFCPLRSRRSLIPPVRPRAVAALPQTLHVRSMASSSNPPPPSERASEIINKLPSSPNLITKAGTAILGTGVAAAAISSELYVINEETVLLVGSLIFLTLVARAIRQPYSDWADGQVARIKDLLDATRADHTQAVKDRIDNVAQMKDVVALTQGLFTLSKETARLESEAFVQKQKTALAAELKGVLDSWVRYEQQMKESEQAELAKTVIDKVLNAMKDEKTQKDVLMGAVAEIELLVKNKAI